MTPKIIEQAQIDRIWPLIHEEIEAGYRKTPSEITADDLLEMCRSGEGFLMISVDSTPNHGIMVWRKAAVGFLECVCIVGKGPEFWFKSMVNLGLDEAAKSGCRGVGGNGRMGWVVLMKKYFPRTRIVRQTYVVEIE